MYSFWVEHINEHKKRKIEHKNVVAIMIFNEYKNAFLNNKCLRHSMKRIQIKGHRIGAFEINKMSLSCFDDKIYIQNNGYDGLSLGC